MEIKLKIENKTRSFTTDFINTRCFRNFLKLQNEVDYENLTDKDLDKMVDLIVEVFGKQFTRDDVYDGLPSNKLIPTWLDVAGGIMGEFNKAVDDGDAEKN